MYIWRYIVWIVVFYTVNFTGAIAGPGKTFKDWSVSCSDGLICTMETYPEDKKVYSLGFERGTAANAGLQMLITIDGELSGGSDVVLSFHGQSTTIKLPASGARFVDYEWVFSLEPHMEQLVRALKAGKTIHVSAVSDKGEISEELSLSGVVASMLFMDETQGRVGKRDALQAKGDEPAKAVVTRVQAIKSKMELPEPVRVTWAQNINECDDGSGRNFSDFDGLRIDLGNDTNLFVLPCGTPGAYNFPFVALAHEISTGIARMLSFPVMGNLGPTNMDMAYNVSWDDKKSQLSAFFRGRGIGDCGSKQLWQWGEASVYGEFELLEERMKDDCDEKIDEFPLIWPPD